ncbi:MFS transporter [Sporolactobacillus sp. KGMB 08714]|uniref:MFS transporter n=1 Tax=Sporolactobacillus sp. KGMB 08714 TaxID=3064704 RepID=UPI002FBE842B
MNKKYYFSASLCYLNYFIYGMAYIMLAQNISFLAGKFHTDATGISFLISMYGVGRLFTIYAAGFIGDKIGRKPMIILGALLMAGFLLGIPLAPNYPAAMIAAILGGLSNACLDTATYPCMMEFFPKYAGSATVLIKAFVSFGSTLLPFIIAAFINSHIYWGWAFFLPAFAYILISLCLIKLPFPPMQVTEGPVSSNKESRFVSKPHFKIEGFSLILIGFTAPALLYIMQTWLPTFGQQAIGMSLESSLKLISWYGIGSVISVLALTIVLKRVKPVTVVLVFPIASFFATLFFLLAKSFIVAELMAFLIGVTIAGVLQLGLTVFCEFFPEKKGTITGIMYTSTGIAQTVIPFLTGLILKFHNVRGIFIFSLMINLLAIVFGYIVNFRYRKLLKLPLKKDGEKAI